MFKLSRGSENILEVSEAPLHKTRSSQVQYKKKEKHFSSNLVQEELKHRHSAGRARVFNVGLPVLLPLSRLAAPHEIHVASAERVRPLRAVAAAGKQLVSNQSSPSRQKIINTVTPLPTDKSGRGGKNNRKKCPN
ncbi:hypothetical protein J6590_005802 [Homalodisca vitripennis]|nr:hypothetical protein J6590_005802 [Homalodisca vitripennis]